MFVNLPPIQAPQIEPNPNAVIIHPTLLRVKPKFSVRQRDRKGITIVPALLINVIKESHHTWMDNPLKEFLYELNALATITKQKTQQFAG